MESAVVNALEAKKEWNEAALEEGIEIHGPDNLEDYSGYFKLEIPYSLHRLLAEYSKREDSYRIHLPWSDKQCR